MELETIISEITRLRNAKLPLLYNVIYIAKFANIDQGKSMRTQSYNNNNNNKKTFKNR